MSVWMPSTAWSRGKRSVSRQIQVIKRKRRKFVAPGKAAVAQMAERRPCKADVAGSKPAGGTITPGSSKGRTRGFGP